MRVRREVKGIRRGDWLLVLSVIFAPMTGLRIWKVGPAEILAILWCLLNYKVYIKMPQRSPMVRFWPWFLSFTFIGAIICLVSYPEESQAADMLTWLYMALISYAVYVEMGKRTTAYLSNVLKLTVTLSVVIYMLLFVYSQSARVFLGARLWYGKRFTGGGDNPHQLALLMGVTSVSGLWMCVTARGLKARIVALIVMLSSIFLLLQTQSSTALMAIVAGCAVMLFESFVRGKKHPRRIRTVAFVLVGLVLLTGFDRLWSLFMDWVAGDSNGLGRFRIFASYPITFWKSPIFGLGPGTHGLDGVMEFHNTYLEVLAMSGIAGGITFLLFTFNVLKEVKRSPYAVGMFATLYVFGFAGFGMRRLIFWIVLSIVCVYARRQRGIDVVKGK